MFYLVKSLVVKIDMKVANTCFLMCYTHFLFAIVFNYNFLMDNMLQLLKNEPFALLEEVPSKLQGVCCLCMTALLHILHNRTGILKKFFRPLNKMDISIRLPSQGYLNTILKYIIIYWKINLLFFWKKYFTKLEDVCGLCVMMLLHILHNRTGVFKTLFRPLDRKNISKHLSSKAHPIWILK